MIEVVAEGDTGFLTPSGDVAALAAAIAKLRADPGLRAALGESARQRVLREFSEERMLDEYESIFRSAAGG